MARITWNKDNDDTLNLFKNGGIVLTGRNLNPAWVKLQREKLEAQSMSLLQSAVPMVVTRWTSAHWQKKA